MDAEANEKLRCYAYEKGLSTLAMLTAMGSSITDQVQNDAESAVAMLNPFYQADAAALAAAHPGTPDAEFLADTAAHMAKGAPPPSRRLQLQLRRLSSICVRRTLRTHVPVTSAQEEFL
jgi:hypothetical protein